MLILDRVPQMGAQPRGANWFCIPAFTCRRARPFFHPGIVRSKLARAVRKRGASRDTRFPFYRLGERRQRRLGVTADRQIHGHEALHVLVV